MKLLELLIQEKVRWPDGALWVVQDFDGELKFTATQPSRPAPSHSSNVWYRQDVMFIYDVYLSTRASDWATKVVSEDEYAAAVAAAKAEQDTVPPKPTLVVTTPILDWYKFLAPIITAAAEGKVVQYLAADGNWYNGLGAFISPNKYRIKPAEPKTIKVNGFDVPEPMREAPAVGTLYFIAYPVAPDYFEEVFWGAGESAICWLSRGLLHSTKEAAVAHAKAMLGTDPYADEDADDEHP